MTANRNVANPRRWAKLSARERRREAILEWVVTIISTFAAFVAVLLLLIVMIGV